ncbi:MAG: flagellar assembly protein A [Campylobacterales bacterium]
MGDFSKFEVVCEDVPKEIKNAAEAYGITPNDIDFDIIDVSTYIQLSENEDFNLLEPYEFDKFFDREFLTNPELKVKQQYKLLLKPIKKKSYNINMQLSANRSLSKIEAIIKKDSKLPRVSELKEVLKEEIDKKKLKLRLLVNLCDKRLNSQLNSVVVAVKSFGSLKQDMRIVVCECATPKESVRPQVVELYKQKQSSEETNDKIDHRDRKVFSHIEEGEAVLKFIKGKLGKPGRDCRGRYIDVEEIENVLRPEFKIDETLQERSNPDEIVFYALRSGFLQQDSDTYRVSEDIKIESVDLKQTGSIKAKKDSKSKIEVLGGAYGEDSIAPNMEVRSKEVIVEGSVGSNAYVEAQVVSINSQTHQNSKIVADKISIKRHKGYAYGKKVIIDILESGYVEAEEVIIINALGGEIRGANIKINNCSSHTKVYATESIVVDFLKGEGSSFIIDGAAFGGLREKEEKIEKEMKTSSLEQKKLEDRKKYLLDFIKKNKESMQSVKEFIKEARKRDTKPSSILIKRLQDYNAVIKELKDLDDKIHILNEDMKIKKLEFDTIAQKVYGAKIEILGGNKSACAVGFIINLEEHKKLSHVPKEHESLFTLKEKGDGYAIDAL